MPEPHEPLPARLVLADGRVFPGRSFGAQREVVAEVVFNTSHAGYQEVLTDPSYRGQAVTFTVPILGIYGVADDQDDQSPPGKDRPQKGGQGAQASAIICREASRRASSYRSHATLHEHLVAVGVPGIEGVDTRTLTKHLRDHGAQNGMVTTSAEPEATLVARVRAAPSMDGLDLAKVVTTAAPYRWEEGFKAQNDPGRLALPRSTLASVAGSPVIVPGSGGRVVVLDFGVKHDILRNLVARGLDVTVVPATTTAEEILERDPDGVLLSNGPDDPAAVGYGIETTKRLMAACAGGGPPVYGVCLGHQILSLAAGAKTFKLKFGHRGANHPVRDEATGRVLITAQNHGFSVDPESMKRTALVTSHLSLFDGTVEGLRHRDLPIAAMQFHPEAAPGPHEAGFFFDQFAETIARHSAASRRATARHRETPAGRRA